LAGGTFAVDSHPGKGTRIIVRIPVEQEREHDTNSAIAG
jgi:signal transduction histidine kinase